MKNPVILLFLWHVLIKQGKVFILVLNNKTNEIKMLVLYFILK